jgi:G3E family GTPase
VLETSGLADPGLIVEAIRSDPILVNHIIVSDVLVMVDGLHALSQLRTEPLGRRQLEIADRYMISKLDEAREEDLSKLLATLRALNPGAAMSGCVQGSEAPLPDFEGVEPEVMAALTDDPDRPPIYPAKIRIDDNIDWTAFSVWLSALLHARGNDVVRVKGVVKTPAGRLLVQTVRKIVQSPEILPEQDDRPDREDGTIVVIGRGYTAKDLTRSLHRFAGIS